jgi:hypothetical protein
MFIPINLDKDRSFCLPKFPYDENGYVVDFRSEQEVQARDKALDIISEEMPGVYNTWMLDKEHHLYHAFTPMIHQHPDHSSSSRCEVCNRGDDIVQLICYSFPYHCRPRRGQDSWDTMHLEVCFDCYVVGGHLFPTWSRGRDYWDAMDGWDVSFDKTIAPIHALLLENCENYTNRRLIFAAHLSPESSFATLPLELVHMIADFLPIRPEFDPRWIGHVPKFLF